MRRGSRKGLILWPVPFGAARREVLRVHSMQRPDAVLRSSTGAKTSPIPRQSLGAAVVERLRDKILSGELREGEQLRQNAIATEFQISRIPVREALSHLAAEGLVTLVANRGAIVPRFLQKRSWNYSRLAQCWNATCSAALSPE